ncbi:hypothetical protein [Nonomuraea jabiensis]|uniref:hypothetical protein n=1 Tax=Nonomuraea jabiensis TaxID=882448 RepID=UPI003D758DF4
MIDAVVPRAQLRVAVVTATRPVPPPDAPAFRSLNHVATVLPLRLIDLAVAGRGRGRGGVTGVRERRGWRSRSVRWPWW